LREKAVKARKEKKGRKCKKGTRSGEKKRKEQSSGGARQAGKAETNSRGKVSDTAPLFPICAVVRLRMREMG
jgi:hypothetical protein